MTSSSRLCAYSLCGGQRLSGTGIPTGQESNLSIQHCFSPPGMSLGFTCINIPPLTASYRLQVSSWRCFLAFSGKSYTNITEIATKLNVLGPIYCNYILLRIWYVFSSIDFVLRSLFARIAYFDSHASTSSQLHPYEPNTTKDHVLHYLMSIYVSAPVICTPEIRSP